MYKIVIVEKKSGEVIENEAYLMREADMMKGARFEAVGMQDDGTPVVFDRCGNFGYLDANKMAINIRLDQK